MKKIMSIFCAAVFVALLGACSSTQEMKEGICFSDIKTFYVDSPVGGDNMFYYIGSRTAMDSVVVSQIRRKMESEGYTQAADRKSAQMIIRPQWNTVLSSETENANIFQTQTLAIGSNNFKAYCMLEIQIYFAGREDWVWRGFGPTELTSSTLNEGTVANQVNWCLSEFPPEKYPDALSKIREERKRKAEEEANPFAHIKVEKPAAQPAQKVDVPEPRKAVSEQGDKPNIVK